MRKTIIIGFAATLIFGSNSYASSYTSIDGITADVDSVVQSLKNEAETLMSEVDTYNSDVEVFYKKILDTTEQLNVRFYNYALEYAETIEIANMSHDDLYNFYNSLYDNATRIIDEIYTDLMNTLSENYGNADYSSVWSDVSYDLYDSCTDARYEISEFYYDLSDAYYDNDMDEVQKQITRFQKKVDRVNGVAIFDTGDIDIYSMTFNTTDELEEQISSDVETTISSLSSELDALIADIDSYSKYLERVDDVEAFYEKICVVTEQLCNRLYLYAITYSEMIINSEDSVSSMYYSLNGLYSSIYNNAMNNVYDDVYNGILEELNAAFHDGIIEAVKELSIDGWRSVSAYEYGMWDDCRTDVYRYRSSIRDDIYDLYSDVGSELYDDDVDGAKETIKEAKENLVL